MKTFIGSDQKAIALIDWCHLIEDYLDPLGLSLQDLSDKITSGWLFGYVEALQTAGMRPIVYYVSARVNEPTWLKHKMTGINLCILPASRLYMAVRNIVPNPYAETLEQAFGAISGPKRIVYWILKELAPYLATPLGSLRRELKRQECSAIICQEYEHPRFDVTVFMGRLIGLPVFATFQGGNSQIGWFERFTRPFALKGCTGLIIASQVEIDRVCKRYRFPQKKVARIFNPIDLSIWKRQDRSESRVELGIPKNSRVVVWHGRVLIRRKGLDLLLDAWKRVCEKRPGQDIRLLMIGTGQDAHELHRRLEVLEPHSITWHNEFVVDRLRMCRYLSAADIYILSSRLEGFPVAPLEAMSCGLAVVAADAPGLRDIFEEGKASGGLVVPIDDAPALANALGILLDDQALRSDLQIHARERIQNVFSLESIGMKLSGFIKGNIRARR